MSYIVILMSFQTISSINYAIINLLVQRKILHAESLQHPREQAHKSDRLKSFKFAK